MYIPIPLGFFKNIWEKLHDSINLNCTLSKITIEADETAAIMVSKTWKAIDK